MAPKKFIEKLSHCRCDKLTTGFRSPGLFERLLLRLVPHVDIVKSQECPAWGWDDLGNFVTCEKCNGTGTRTDLYLRRFFLFRSKWFGLNLGDLYLHHIVRSDDDPDPHDHPWGFLGFVLYGGYTDEQWHWYPAQCPDSTFKGVRSGPHHEVVKPLRFILRRATHIHRVRLNRGRTAWTLIFTSGYSRDWNFVTQDGPIFWRTYLGIPGNEDTGV